jgi:carboxyl-terminal processing protease
VKRRAFLGTALAFTTSRAMGVTPARGGAADFDAMWRAIDEGYAYFDDASRARWRALRDRGRQQAARASGEALLESLERAIADLRDDHVTIAGKSASRRIPYDLDIWPRWRGGVAAIEAVRTFGDADVAGLHAGQAITRIQDVPVETIVREKLGRSAGNVADIEWALRRAIAGPRVGIQKLEVRDADRVAVVPVERTRPAPTTAPAFLARRMGMSERDIGYIRVRVGAEEDLARQFAGGLAYIGPARALIMDLRENAGPGDRQTTLAILSRFARTPSPWQVRQPSGAAKVTDVVQPSGTPYTGPVAVLVDRWTAGEGEALAAGLAAVARAQIVGTPMSGLRGEVRSLALPGGLVLRYPAERTFTVAGQPRETITPSIAVDLAAPAGGPGDPILYRALKLFERA